MIISAIFVYDCMDSILFDLYSSFSYESIKFMIYWDLDYEYLYTHMYMSNLIVVSICVD